MSETKFTPGPWEVRPHTAPEYGDLNCCTFAIFETTQVPYQVATVMGDAGLACHCVANANLIAAAPEMFEALNNLFQSYTSDKSEVFHERLSDLMFHAGVALAKAGRA